MIQAAPSARRAPPLLVGAAAGAIIAMGLVVAVLRPRRVVVEGGSMEPTLGPGDRLLVLRARRVRPGDLVAARDPRVGARIVVKRVSAVLDNGVVLRGDNPEASTDSRVFGAVPAHAVLGRVVRRYGPSWRAGPVS